MHEILSLRLENFLSFGEAEFDFERAGVVLVEGRNGSGKSAMVDGILWCLFGKTLRGYEHDKVVHRRVGENCLASVRLRTGGQEWGVTRARRHKKLKNSLVIVDSSGSGFVHPGDKETQAEVERRLGCSYKTFLSSVVFGQDRAYRFSSLTDAEQKKILDEVIGVERFAAACAAARARVSSTQVGLEGARRNLGLAEKARDEAEAEAVDLRAKDADFAESQGKKIEAERGKLRAAKKWLKENKRVDVAAIKAEVELLLKELADRERRVDKAGEVSSSARALASAAKTRVDQAMADLGRRQKLKGDCPTCKRPVDRETMARVVRVCGRELSALETEHLDASGVADDAERALERDRRELKKAREAMTALQRALNEGIGAEANVIAWRRRVADHEARIAELEGEASPYAELARKAGERRAAYAEQAALLGAEVAELEAGLRLAQFWVKAFGASGLRSLLIDSSLPLLNEEAARVSRALTGGAISIEFSATTEQKSGKVVDRFEVRVDNEDGADDYAGNSAGERAKVDLCVGLALQRLVASRSPASFNVAVFDEVFDHLDSASHEPVVEVLSDLDKDSVYVVSHDEDLKAWFPTTLRMAKRDGFSSVEV